jgi:hypothetical protein
MIVGAVYLVSAKQCSDVRVISTNPTRIGAVMLFVSVLTSEASTIKNVVFATPIQVL